MPGGLGRSSGFHSDLNRGCGTYLDGKWKVWGVGGENVCVWRAVFFSGTKLENSSCL